MKCGNCGAEATLGLRYCKRCGENLNDTTSQVEAALPSRPVRFTGAAWAMAFAITAITLGGFGIIFGTTIGTLGILTDGPNAARNSIRDMIPIVVPMMMFGSLTILAVDFMLMKLFSRLLNLPLEASRPEKQKAVSVSGYRASPNNLPPPQISSPPLTMPSVTEHTTRNFDPIPSLEQKSRE